ncbi:MAG: AbrB/MazE/SpoVT family DNA-binding domain-containing protein [Firmicutes bacterium]|nr:AbrB/MazE/SpoVT family DNA-binding domain-containing protein [Bacillota bacterium]
MRKITTVTKKGQVTIPRIVREKLQINCGDKVEFTFNKQGQVVLQPVKTNLDDLYGILKNEKPDLDIDEQRKIARDWIANQKGRS